jgi:cytochrome P450
MEQLTPRIQEMADELLDRMLAAPDRRADLVEALSFPLPMSVICELLGVPFLDRGSFREWSNIAVLSVDSAARVAATGDMTRYMAGLLADKRARPGDDLMSALIHTADDDGDRLSEDELMGMAWLLLVAGHETTVNLISNGVLALSSVTRTNWPHCAPTSNSSTTRWRRRCATRGRSRPPRTGSPPSRSTSAAPSFPAAANWS